MKITDRCAAQGSETVFVCDFSPLKGADPVLIEDARGIDTDFICVAYNPGKAVRVDSAMLAYTLKQHAGRDAIFNLATRDMNRLAIQSHLLGAQMLGLENLMVLQGDRFTEKDLARVKDVSDFKPTELIQAVAAMNQGIDFKGLKLTRPTDFCIGASVDLGRGVQREARLAHRKATAGAHFFLTQPVFSTGEMEAFLDAYQDISGEVLSQPVFFGLQVLVSGGVIFSNVPEAIRQDLEKGRAGTDIALELLHKFQDAGFRRIYLIPPILKGGARDYQAAQKVLKKTRLN